MSRRIKAASSAWLLTGKTLYFLTVLLTGCGSPYTKSFLYHEMEYGCKASGVKRIRVHDIRHSHASLLVEMGFSPLLIAERLGHEKVQTTMDTYSHLYPNKQVEVARQLDGIMP